MTFYLEESMCVKMYLNVLKSNDVLEIEFKRYICGLMKLNSCLLRIAATYAS